MENFGKLNTEETKASDKEKLYNDKKERRRGTTKRKSSGSGA
jgi:hypothetical protein